MQLHIVKMGKTSGQLFQVHVYPRIPVRLRRERSNRRIIPVKTLTYFLNDSICNGIFLFILKRNQYNLIANLFFTLYNNIIRF